LEALPKKRALLWGEQGDKLGNYRIQHHALRDRNGQSFLAHGVPFFGALAFRFTAVSDFALCGFGGVLSMRRSTSSS